MGDGDVDEGAGRGVIIRFDLSYVPGSFIGAVTVVGTGQLGFLSFQFRTALFLTPAVVIPWLFFLSFRPFSWLRARISLGCKMGCCSRGGRTGEE
jgi:hypothetical protein